METTGLSYERSMKDGSLQNLYGGRKEQEEEHLEALEQS